MSTVANDAKPFNVDALKVEIHPTAQAAAAAAAQAAAIALRKLALERKTIGVIFATGVSQFELLSELTDTPDVPWSHIVGFHMDEYIGIPSDHPASFRRYLRERLTQVVHMRKFFEVNGSAADPEQACREYAAELRTANPQLCFSGIGENGHLAFNDPGVADFHDPLDMKVVHMDDVCRRQQLGEGWFKSLEEVPELAMTLTIPALMRVPKLIVSVPGLRKAKIVRRTLEGPVSTECPATILRTHPDATLYLDREAASELHVASV